MPRISTLLPLLLAAACCARPARAQDTAAGRKQFEALCAGCHGEDGGGGEHAPGIVDQRRRGNLREVIANGIPDGGMPPFALAPALLDSLVAYIEMLRSPAGDHPSAGDAGAGERFFHARESCSSCHMVRGRGGTLGPDLSNLARTRRLAQIEAALNRPDTLSTPGYRHVTLRLLDGQSVRGLAKNESSYDVQLQSLDGTLHFFTRGQIAEIVREPHSLMPPVKASDAEMRDLLAFLTRLTGEGALSSAAASTPHGGPTFSEIANPRRWW